MAGHGAKIGSMPNVGLYNVVWHIHGADETNIYICPKFGF